MIRCLAIDDEPLALRQITGYIEKIPFLELARTFNSAVQAQQYLLGEKVDLIFVDINMPDLNGVEFVRSLESPPMIIFTTAYSEYAIEGFKLDAIDYLLKPFGFKEFSRSVNKANSLYELLNMKNAAADSRTEAEESTSSSDKEYISVRADYKTSLIKISNIVYLESEGEYVRMNLNDGTKVVTLFRLKNMESSLPSDTFMRVHRSYIVNLKCITGYTKGRIFLENDDYVPIGENYKEAFLKYIGNKF